MVLELHVWGPAFSLPSIDPQCLAAIAYLDRTVPRGQWILIASSDIGRSPTKELPALRDEQTVVGGFQNIVDYLHRKSDGEWDLDHDFASPKHRADIIAFYSHVLTHARPLLDLSLYVSSENYTTATRPSYSSILPWPTQYFIPPQHRDLAKRRTEHLGLSSLDLDNVDEEEERNRRKLGDVVPAALRTSKQTVTGLVKRKQSGARFRLDALIDVLCEPLEQFLGEKTYFLSEKEPSTLDCLALGYLAFALKPEVPQKWLQEGMRDRYPRLCAFVERGVEECFGGEVRVEDAFLHQDSHANSAVGGTDQTSLPWRPPEQSSINVTGISILNNILSLLPYSQTTILTSPADSSSNTTSKPGFSPGLPFLITGGAAVAATAGYLLYDASVNPLEPEKRRLEDMGEAGAMLAGFDFAGVGEVVREESL